MCKSMGGMCHPKMKAVGLLALRVALGVIFIYTGYTKLFPGHAGAAAMFSQLGFPGSGSAWAYFVGFFELIGGLMVLLGIFANFAAAWLSVILVVAMLTAHRGGPFMGYFLPLSMLGGCLALYTGGAGPWRLLRMQCPCPKCKGMTMGGGCGCGGKCSGNCAGGDKMMDCKCHGGCCGGKCTSMCKCGICGCGKM